MGDKNSFIFWIKESIAGVSFYIFLWATGVTQEQYLYEIYIQEKEYRENK